ncbi:hypothetical protein Pfo_001169 [Paulownia fortunei]|nr:hypothetical protein Pfo_001169 [Paulownia fortunei]
MNKNEEVHVVMLPWLAFGHMIPFLELSIALARSGIHVSFLSTPRNIQRLPKIPPDKSEFIDFVPFPLPKLDSNLLPENAESTLDIPADKMDCLKIACDLLQEPNKNFIAEKLPSWIVVDFFPHWAVDIAQELNIPIIKYFVTTASTAVFFWAPEFLAELNIPIIMYFITTASTAVFFWTPDFVVGPDWVDFPSQVACRNHEAIAMHNIFYSVNASGISDGGRGARLVQAIAIRTCPEFEADYLKLFSEIAGKPVIPLGFLPPEKSETKTVTREPWSTIFNWLDQQKPRSVVFIGFGKIAYGVELSGLPFLWALRKPDGVDHNDLDALPPGFCTRTAAQGVVHVGWAPQREILGHPSVGGSFFHAGWGSVIEAMQYGHALVFLPFIIDQPLNARLLVEKDLGIEVERAEDGSFTRNDIANALRKAMVSEEGLGMRARAEKAAHKIFGDHKLQPNYVEKFAEYLKNEAHVHHD